MRDGQGLDNVSPEYDHQDMANTDPVTRYDPFDGALSMSLAARVGNLVYTSGIIGLGSDMKIPDNPKEEFRQVFSSIGAALANLGTSLEHAVDMTNFFASRRSIHSSTKSALRCSARGFRQARVFESPSCFTPTLTLRSS